MKIFQSSFKFNPRFLHQIDFVTKLSFTNHLKWLSSRFRLVSLNRLADTKSSSNKGITLLHYLVDMLEKKFKDILKLDEDISFVREASKVR